MAAFPSSATAIDAKLNLTVPKIRAIILRCVDKLSGIMQPSVDQIVQICLEAGLAVKRNIMPRNTGIHPENRGKTGVDPFNAQRLTLKISMQGYSETKLESPMGFEKAAAGPVHDYQEAFNEKNFAEGNGYIRYIPFREIEYLPVTCSHTHATVNIVEGCGPGLDPALCNDAGMIDKNKVLDLCPSWEKPMKEGIPCTVFKRELDVACPELAPFLSKAGNQTHGVHIKETKVQLMLTLNQCFVSRKRRAAIDGPAALAPTWEKVVKEAVSIKGIDQADTLAELATFAAAWAGGDASPALIEVESYAKQRRTVGMNFAIVEHIRNLRKIKVHELMVQLSSEEDHNQENAPTDGTLNMLKPELFDRLPDLYIKDVACVRSLPPQTVAVLPHRYHLRPLPCCQIVTTPDRY